MLALGVDPGTAITGYGLVSETDDGRLIAIDYGVIRTSQDETAGKRLSRVVFQVERNHMISTILIAGRWRNFFFSGM